MSAPDLGKMPVPVRAYDGKNHRLVFLGETPDREAWDTRWDVMDVKRLHQRMSRHGQICRLVKRYLDPTDGRILEAGCGLGQHVFALRRLGYECIGVDFADATVRKVNEAVPELDIRCQDIRRLGFEDGAFAAVCSFGVIEHFVDGYEAVLREFKRVTRPGGYLFLSFPHMSPLRKFKARLGRYPAFGSGLAAGDFWQYALDPRVVAGDLKRLGYVCLRQVPLGGLKGVTGEIGGLSPGLKTLHHYQGTSTVLRAFKLMCDRGLALLGGIRCS